MLCENKVVLIQAAFYCGKPLGPQPGYLVSEPWSPLLWQILCEVFGASWIHDIGVGVGADGGVKGFQTVVFVLRESSRALREVDIHHQAVGMMRLWNYCSSLRGMV